MFDVCIVNDDLEDAYGKLKDALLEVSRAGGGNRPPTPGGPLRPRALGVIHRNLKNKFCQGSKCPPPSVWFVESTVVEIGIVLIIKKVQSLVGA